ncbi:MAG: cytochrome c oxidase subunit II [Deltaproteobacteria bacterium]|nr:cytochrome c oxidase subunit II [Deltaproteobacteria bacterium]
MNPTSFLSLLAPAASGGEPTTWLPVQASAVAKDVDSLFYFILYLSTFFFVAIVFVTVLFVLKYRKRGDQAHPTSGNHHNRKLEITWSVIPAILLIVVFLWGFRDWMGMNVPPKDAMEVRVLARKWNWQFDYPSLDVTGQPELAVPVGKPVKLIMSATDVLHSFYVPAFRVKKDVIPNRYTVLWFQADRPGTYDIYCTEYCGTGHSGMFAKVKVLSPLEFQSWADNAGGGEKLGPVKWGEKLFTGRGCVGCHNPTRDQGGKPGPALAGKFGSDENLASGATVRVDDNYIRKSLMEPGADVVKGFQPVMPTYQGQLKDKEINALIEYIKSLK